MGDDDDDDDGDSEDEVEDEETEDELHLEKWLWNTIACLSDQMPLQPQLEYDQQGLSSKQKAGAWSGCSLWSVGFYLQISVYSGSCEMSERISMIMIPMMMMMMMMMMCGSKRSKSRGSKWLHNHTKPPRKTT